MGGAAGSAGTAGAAGSAGAAGAGGTAGSAGAAGSGGSAGAAGAAGSGGVGGSTGAVFPCSEQGIRDAIAEGGGPHTFDCGTPELVVTREQIIIDNDVILDGEDNLTVDGNQHHRVFWVTEGVTATLRRFAVTRGSASIGGGVFNQGGTLTVADSTLIGNLAEFAGAAIHNSNGDLTLTNTSLRANRGDPGSSGGGIYNSGTLKMSGCTISGNSASEGGGIDNDGTLTITNSTISGNTIGDGTGGAIANTGTVMLIACTLSDNQAAGISGVTGSLTVANSIIDGDCAGPIDSRGYNIESPSNTCGLDQTSDLADVTSGALGLEPLGENGGPTQTHALAAGSVAIDAIPQATCDVDADQRGQPRPEPAGTMCDVGAFELQP